MDDPTRNGRRWGLVLFLLLAFCLCFPVVGGLMRLPAPPEFRDMRTLSPWPDPRATPLRKWPGAFEAWLNDHFPLRARIITWNGFVRHRILEAPGGDVVVGRDGWLFYAGNSTLADWAGRDPLSERELLQWAKVLEGRNQWLRARGTQYLFVLVPNKSTVYPEHLPALLRAQHRPGKLDQLVDYLRAHTSVHVLDLRPALLALKARQVGYWLTDSHWNGYGHVAAYAAIMDRLQEMGVSRRAPDDEAWIQVGAERRHTDLIELLGMSGQWPAPPVPLVRIRRPPDLKDAESGLAKAPVAPEITQWGPVYTTERASGRGRAVLICDSFFRVGGLPADGPLAEPFMLSFRRFSSAWCWRPTFRVFDAIVKEEHPDIVIEEQTERFLKAAILDDDPEFAKARAAAGGPLATVP